ncbi:uncharacterized protein OCT59_027256 [Rhizophagus irregularis]|nr:hypothetical protein OCT59_027256 [Rhizophagus irregularis]GBC45243.2 kinase-like domain-containing protein [Rhizophagus irregularis DAOM 181602=DAOM 197198]
MLEYTISEWIRCINEYYEINRDGKYKFEAPNIENQLKNDMLEFVAANKAILEGQASTSTIQYHSQAYYTSRRFTEISVQEESQGFDCMIED